MYFIGFEWIQDKKVPKLQIVTRAIAHFPTRKQFWAMWCHYVYTTLSIESKVLQIVDNTNTLKYFIGFQWIHAKKVPKLQIVPRAIAHFPTWKQFWAMWCHYVYTTLSVESKVLRIVDNTIN